MAAKNRIKTRKVAKTKTTTSAQKSRPAEKASAQTAKKGKDVSVQIQKRAYEIFLQRGAQHGSDMDHWLEAERSVLGKN